MHRKSIIKNQNMQNSSKQQLPSNYLTSSQTQNNQQSVIQSSNNQPTISNSLKDSTQSQNRESSQPQIQLCPIQKEQQLVQQLSSNSQSNQVDETNQIIKSFQITPLIQSASSSSPKIISLQNKPHIIDYLIEQLDKLTPPAKTIYKTKQKSECHHNKNLKNARIQQDKNSNLSDSHEQYQIDSIIVTDLRNNQLCFSTNSSSNQHQDILKTQIKIGKILFHYQFIDLQIFSVQRSQINNCQFVQFLNAPKLQSIFIFHNKITQLKSIIKLNIPNKLDILNFSDNCIQEIQALTRLKTSKSVNSLVIQFSSFKAVVNQSISILYKLEAAFYDRIRVCNSNVIDQSKVKQKLAERFRTKDDQYNDKFISIY